MKTKSFDRKRVIKTATSGNPTVPLIISPEVNMTKGEKDDVYIEYLAAIVESSDDAIISNSLDGIIQTWNKGAEKMFGFPSNEIAGKHISVIIPSAYINEEKMIMERIHNNEVIEHYETMRIKKSGEQFYVSLTVSPLKDRAGSIIGVSKIIHDSTSRKKIEVELIQANKELAFQNEEKEKRAAELILANKELAFQNEEKEKRAIELIIANKELAFQNEEKEKRAAELILANRELLFQNKEKEKRAAELGIANIELAFQNEEKEKRADELIIANKELAFQNEEKEKRALEKEKRAEELIIANKELAFQNKEKEKRAAELGIANIELAFQNEEKEKRAEELVIANKELAFQNEEKEKRALEKEKRAEELAIANKELSFQNKEKEKRAAELGIANIELAYQNEEKEKRALELIIANKELAFQNEEKEKRATELLVANNELKTVEEALGKSNQLFFSLFEHNPTAIAITCISNSVIVKVNSSLLSLFGFDTMEEVIGKTSVELNMLADPQQGNEMMRQLKENNGTVNLEGQIQTRQGELKWVSTFAHAIEIDGEPHLLAAILDITARKKAEEELHIANKELESFSYSVSHDLRAPLRAIHGYAKMLQADYENQLDSEANRLINNIMNNAKKMGQLIDELLTFSRIGRKDLVMMNIAMHTMVSNFCNELRNEQSLRNIEFHIGELLPAQADNMAIKQVWVNLISNAIKYSKLKNKAIIEISSELKDDEIIYSIKDNGAGFDMRYADKLFGVFQRLHSDEEFEGTGVGLALVHRIITKHGGRVWAEGKVNEGAIFYFTLNKS